MKILMNDTFGLPEYEIAFANFLNTAVHEFMAQKDEVFGSIKSVPSPEVPTFQNTLESGAVVESKPMLMALRFAFAVEDILDGNPESVAVNVDRVADEALATVMPQLFEYIGRLCKATGNEVNGKGEPISHDLILRCLETMEIPFDDEGNPEMPKLVLHPHMIEALGKLPPPTAAQETALQALIERKKREFYDRRGTRKLY